MLNVATLNSELEQIVTRRETIRRENPGAVMPEAARAEDDRLVTRAAGVRTLIEEARQAERDAAFAETETFVNQPQYNVTRAVNDDDDGRRTLMGAGWALRNDMWYKQTSVRGANGQPMEVAMYPNEALFGPLPTDDQTASRFISQVRNVIQPGYKDAWTKWFRNSISMGRDAFSRLSGPEQNALSEGNDGAGGFTVPPDYQAEIGGRRAQTSVMRSLATVTPTTRDHWTKPMIKANATAANRNIFSDDFVAAWVGETPSQASIDAVFELFEISIKKLRAYSLLSNDLIADSVGNLVAELASRGGRSLGLQEDNGFIAGGSVPLEPQGILSHSLALTATSSNGMAVDVEGSVSNTISNSVSSAGSAPLIKGLVYKLPSQYTANASWIMRRTIQGSIAGLVDANGRPFWNSYLDSGFTRPQMQIEGFPVYNSEFVGTDGSVSAGPSTIPLIFGDISEYRIVERQQLSVRVLTERFGDTDQTGLFLFSRVGGGLWNYDAIRTGVILS